MSRENRAEKVRGHACKRLMEFQDVGIGCIPSFDEEGNTVGCDDTNYLAIQYCPFCGVKLTDKETPR